MIQTVIGMTGTETEVEIATGITTGLEKMMIEGGETNAIVMSIEEIATETETKTITKIDKESLNANSDRDPTQKIAGTTKVKKNKQNNKMKYRNIKICLIYRTMA